MSPIFVLGALALSSPLWSRPDSLRLTNHPLIVQLGTSNLPKGSFNRCLLAREAIVAGLEAAAATACSGSTVSSEAATLLSLLADERIRSTIDADEWLAAAATEVQAPGALLRSDSGLLRIAAFAGTEVQPPDHPQVSRMQSINDRGWIRLLEVS